MPLNLTSNDIAEKNKANQANPWLDLLEFNYPGEDPGRVCLNNVQVTWDGNIYYPACLVLEESGETKNVESPHGGLTIADPLNTLNQHIDKYNGGIGATVTHRIVHSQHLDDTNPKRTQEFEIIDVNVDGQNNIRFELGDENLMDLACPQNRYLKNHCRYKEFKGELCGYAGAETDCDRTIATCKAYGNFTRYGGQPGVGSLGVQI